MTPAPLSFAELLRTLNIRSESPSGTKGDAAVQAAIDECARLCPDFVISFGASRYGNPLVRWAATHAGKEYEANVIVVNARSNPAILRQFFFYARDSLRQATSPQEAST